MSDKAKRIAKEHFDFVLRCYPDALVGLMIKNNPTVYRTYLYGVMKAVLGMELDTFVKMYLLQMLKDEIGMSSDELAAAILKYAAGNE